MKLAKFLTRTLLTAIGASLSFAVAADALNESRARVNYMLNCQGCHGADAGGNSRTDVPRMRDEVGNFLRVSGGREYLVQVPGSANASIDDAQLAELLNWMLPAISAAQMPTNFAPYTEAEVTALRYSPEEDVQGKRAQLIQAINSLPKPADRR